MIRIINGHLGSGNWRLKKQNHIPFISHTQMFSRRGEYRIGPNQVISVTKIRDEKNEVLVEIKFSENRHCQAFISPEEFAPLASMVDLSDDVPLAEDQTQNWIYGLGVFVIITLILEATK